MITSQKLNPQYLIKILYLGDTPPPKEKTKDNV